MSTNEGMENTILLWKKDKSWLDVSYEPQKIHPFFCFVLVGDFCLCFFVWFGLVCVLFSLLFFFFFFVTASSVVKELGLWSARRMWHLDLKGIQNPLSSSQRADPDFSHTSKHHPF